MATVFISRFVSRFILCIAVMALVGCAPMIKGYRQNMAQGQQLTTRQVYAIHVGMTRDQVEGRLGAPVLTNVYEPTKMIYIFTMLPVHGKAYKRQLILTLHHNKVISISIMNY